jgi:hypothetical protein
MHITKNMFYRYPDLNACLKATDAPVIQERLANLRDAYTFWHKDADGWISKRHFSSLEIAASQGLILHVNIMLESVDDNATLPTSLINMLHSAIENQQWEMIDFCINHPYFKKDLITSKTLLFAAYHGPTLLFQQLFEQIYPSLLRKNSNLCHQLACEAISGGQHDSLKYLLAYNSRLINSITATLSKSHNASVGPLTDTMKHKHTDTMRFLLTFEPIRALLPSIGLHLLNHAIQTKHAAAVDLLLRFDAVQNHLKKQPAHSQEMTLLLAASAGNAYIFERLLTIEFLKQNLLTDMSYMFTSDNPRQVINAWTSAIAAGHVGIACIIFDTVSDNNKERLKADISALSHVMGQDKNPGNPAMLEYLLSFEAMQNEFNQKAFYYMQMACCIYPEQEVLQPRVRDTSIPMFNFLLDAPIIRKKMREGDLALRALVDNFITRQLAELKRIQGNAPPLSLDRSCYFLEMLQKTKWYRPGSAEDITYFVELPHTHCDESGAIDPRVARVLPWMQYQRPTINAPRATHTLRFLDAQKNKRKNEASASDDESVASDHSYS